MQGVCGSVVWPLLNGDHREPTSAHREMISAIPTAVVRRDEPALLEIPRAWVGRVAASGVRAADPSVLVAKHVPKWGVSST